MHETNKTQTITTLQRLLKRTSTDWGIGTKPTMPTLRRAGHQSNYADTYCIDGRKISTLHSDSERFGTAWVGRGANQAVGEGVAV